MIKDTSNRGGALTEANDKPIPPKYNFIIIEGTHSAPSMAKIM